MTTEKTKRKIFYSFHFKKDFMRVQQIRNIGNLEDNKPVSLEEWVEVQKKGVVGLEKWVEENMSYRACVVVLIGEETASRPLVQYEILKAWTDKRPMFGIYIHNLKTPHVSSKGVNPFDQIPLNDGKKLSSKIICYDPNPKDAYADIAMNIEAWVEKAVKR